MKNSLKNQSAIPENSKWNTQVFFSPTFGMKKYV